MCHYNSSEFIDELLHSISMQTYTNWFMYIYDDGSNEDHKKRLLNSLETIEGKYEIIFGEHVFPYAARLTLYNMAKGDIILTIDSDDMFISDTFFEEICTLFQDNTDMVIFNATTSLINKKPMFNFDKFKTINRSETLIKILRHELCCTWQLNSIWNKAFSKFLVKNILSNKNKLMRAEDRLTNLYLFDKIKNCVIFPEVRYYYRQHQNSIMHYKQNSLYAKSRIIVEGNVEEYAKIWGVEDYSFNKNICNIVYSALINYWANNGRNYDWYNYANSLKDITEISSIDEKQLKNITLLKQKIPVRLFINNHLFTCGLFLRLHVFIYKIRNIITFNNKKRNEP